jgi:hypothetical protein
MGSFSASLRTIGDRRRLPATVTLDHGRVSIEAGEHPIGEWSLDEVHFEPTGNGYRMAAEGEHILLEIQDSENFEIELRGRTGGRKKPAKPAKIPKAPKADSSPPEKTTRAETPPRESRRSIRQAPIEEIVESSPSKVDALIAKAEKRWGSLLPAWVFSRKTLFAIAGVPIVTVFLPGLISTLLLITGLLSVLFGAVAYTDQVMAAKWLPGRMTPLHVLIGGVGLLMVGVLVGIIA